MRTPIMGNDQSDHNHVNHDPSKPTARCGGPTLCPACALAWARASYKQPKTIPPEAAMVRDGLGAILEVMNWATDSGQARQNTWTWVTNAILDLLDGKTVCVPGRQRLAPLDIVDDRTPEQKLADGDVEGPDDPDGLSRSMKFCCYIEPSKLEALRALSKATGVPQAEYVRRGVTMVLEAHGGQDNDSA